MQLAVFRHKLTGNNPEHVFKLFCLFGCKPFSYPVHHHLNILGVDIIIIEKFLRHLQMIFAFVGIGILLFDIAFTDKGVDLICRVRLRNPDTFGEFANRRLPQGINNLRGERLGGA